jgi:outer membrane protein TolC
MRLFTRRIDPRRRSGGLRPPLRGLRLLLHVGLALTLASSASCCRKFYRKSADEEVSNVLAEKDKYPAWQIEQWHVYPDPRARFADPTNPDRPPMPPDDPAARDLAPNPQKPPHKGGVAYTEGFGYLDLLAAWDAENRARLAEKSADGAVQRTAATAYGPQTGQPRGYLLTIDQAVELGLINSREYQTRREDLYLVALPVTLQRFAFAAQWFATEQAIREWIGHRGPGGPQNRWISQPALGFNKLFPTGALLLLQWANRTVVNLTSSTAKHTISESTLTLDLVQPFLRGGGKAVNLEPLTQTERALVYEIRDYAHFRKQFYVFIAGGGDIGRGAQQVTGRAALATTPGFLAPPQGYLPILLIGAQLNNERQNAAELERLLLRFRDFKEGGIVQQLQVDQVEQQMQNSRNTILLLELNYRDALDRLKLQLGIPPCIDLELEDSPLQPLGEQFRRYENVIQQFDAARDSVLLAQETTELAVGSLAGYFSVNALFPTPIGVGVAVTRINAAEIAPPLVTSLLAGQLRPRVYRALTASALMEGTTVRARLLESWPGWMKRSEKEIRQRLTDLIEQQQILRAEQARREKEGGALSERQQQELAALQLESAIGELELALRQFEGRPWLNPETAKKEPDLYARLYQRGGRFFLRLLTEARRERLNRLTATWPVPPALKLGEVDLLQVELPEAQGAVAQAALINRFDLMNARARLVDAWRQIAVTANALLGVLNVRYRLEYFTPFGEAQPFNFGNSRFRDQLIFNGELPLVRKLERNEYRAALINYQRQRRELMATEDNVVVGVREEIRLLRQLVDSYKIQRRLVELAYLQVESSQEELEAPPPVGGAGTTAASAAALTQQRLNAQASLLRAQNQLYATWINYLTTRLELYRDLELMPLDFRGVWTDELADLSRDGPDGRAPATQRPAPDGQRPEQLPAPRPLPGGEQP